MRAKDKIAASSHGQGLVAYLIRYGQTWIRDIQIVSSHGLIGSINEDHVIDLVLHLIRAQGRVARHDARHDHAVKVDGVESEADMFKL